MQKVSDPSDDTKYLIMRFLRKETSPAEIEILEQWLKEHPDHRRIFIEISEAYQNLPTSHYGYRRLDDVWNGLSEKIQSANEAGKGNTTTNHASQFSWLKIAASVTIFLLAYAGWMYFRPETGPAPSDIVARAEQIKKLALPDGTTVWLNTNSSIRYSPDFGKKHRTIVLEGEAFFDVAKTGMTFVVQGKNLDVIVKGTRFNVNTLNESDAEVATLEEGSIVLKVKGRAKPFNMKPGQQVSVNSESKEIIVRQVNPQSYSAWKEAPLRFEKASLGAIIEKLERRYHVRIKIDSDVANREFLSMTIQDETLEEVLELIKISSSLQYTIRGDTIIIYE